MTLLEQINFTSGGLERAVELYAGDLASIPEHEAVDLLVVSAFPDDYAPTANSLIGALDRRGISVDALATAKEVDLRRFCWLSHEIEPGNANFRRLLCFEPSARGSAPELVGDVFRSIVPFCGDHPGIRQIAMPLLAAGDQGESPTVMLDALVDAAVHWLSAGLPITSIKIVVRNGQMMDELISVFCSAKSRFEASAVALAPRRSRFDVFLSYSRKDQEAADSLVELMRELRPRLRVFVDRLELQPGAAWQQHIFEALDESRKVVPLLSPAYLASKVCKEEFNIALFRQGESADSILLPVWLRTAELPSYMKMLQAFDAREGQPERLAAISDDLLRRIPK